MADVTINPSTSALLLLNMQNHIIKRSDRPLVPMGSTQLIANCRKLLDRARQVGMPVFHVPGARRPDLKAERRTSLGIVAGGTLPASFTPTTGNVAGGPIEGTPGAQIVAELAPRPGEAVVTRRTVSPFHHTDIGVYLRRLGVSTLVLTGCSVASTVDATLRDARDLDYDIVVVRDCCVGDTMQEHDTFMDITFPRHAWVASLDQVLKAIRG